MRVAVTTHPNPSHLVGALAAARAARHAGYEVAVVSGPGVTDLIEAAGFPALTVPSMQTIDELLSARAAAAQAPVAPRPVGGGRSPASAHPFITPHTGRQAAEVVELLRRWQPTCVLRECTELGGYLAAETLGVPYATVDIAPLSPCSRPGALDELNRLRAEFDLPAVDDPWHPARPFRVGLVPDIFYPAELRWPSATYYRPATEDEQVDRAAAAGVSGPDGEEPLVLMSLGMNAPRFDPRAASLLDAAVEALGQLPVRAVVAIGSGHDPDGWDGTRAANVRLESFVPQRQLLPSCDLFITHGGFNGVREAIDSGVPMVALPLFGDHPASAARLARLGVAVELDADAVTAAALGAAMTTVLRDPGYRTRAADLRRRMRALPPLDRMAADLRSFVAAAAR
ncbi:glycosyltransferase [Micromonospora carbonacea]|uniref:Glycosyltransferase family 1 protein n=1 Tax=Micromonospora carbonacea TaxID=47853 RepID=A0A7H8XTC4_9ACTN|nr:glycosyltransferase [Micromonospora carbonacea]MBB5830127.1 N-glycosyltransferase [Micromonospora carbonacea]QLD27954.1 glycosyltransferase family 1 protein [Micromonospora carbonacea]